MSTQTWILRGISGNNFRVTDDVKSIAIGAFMRTQLILMLCRLPKLMRAITVVALSPAMPFRLLFVSWMSVGE
jgi:hypothetical protein